MIQSLEVEVQVKEQERAAMEENLSAAFGAVIKELQDRLNAALQARPLPSAAAGSSRRKAANSASGNPF